MENRNKLRDHLNILREIDVSAVATDEKLFNYKEIDTELRLIFKSAQTALNYPGFIDELPEQDAQQILNAVVGLYNVLLDIMDHRYDSTWLAQNYNNTVDNVKNRYRELYKLLVVPVREYSSSLESNEARIQEFVSENDKLRQDLEKMKNEYVNVVQHAQDAASDISTVELSKHFESLIGVRISYRWSDRKKEYLERKKPYEVKSKKSKDKRIKNFMKTKWLWLSLLLKYLKVNIRRFIFSFDSGYERSSRNWLNIIFTLIILTIALGFYIKLDIDNIISNKLINTQSIFAIALVKLVLILAPIYAIKFSIRNYSANKHLAVVNQHKAVVMKTLLAFADRQDISSEIKGEIMTTAVKETFATPETGFVKEKEGISNIEQNIFDRIKT